MPRNELKSHIERADAKRRRAEVLDAQILPDLIKSFDEEERADPGPPSFARGGDKASTSSVWKKTHGPSYDGRGISKSGSHPSKCSRARNARYGGGNDRFTRRAASPPPVQRNADLQTASAPKPPDPAFVIEVVAPPSQIRCIIDTTAEWVSEHGAAGERALMAATSDRPEFDFIADFDGSDGLYYRWKLFSLLNGDRHFTSKTRKERSGYVPMIQGSHYRWKPPCASEDQPPATAAATDENPGVPLGGAVEGFVSSLTHLTLERASIKRGMTMLMDAEPKCSEEMALALMKSFTSIEKHSTANLLARLYLVSDVLSNCSKPECRRYSVCTMVEKRLPEAFEILKKKLESIASRIEREAFRTRVANTLRAWSDVLLMNVASLSEGFVNA